MNTEQLAALGEAAKTLRTAQNDIEEVLAAIEGERRRSPVDRDMAVAELAVEEIAQLIFKALSGLQELMS